MNNLLKTTFELAVLHGSPVLFSFEHIPQSKQEIVEGLIEAVYPFQDQAALLITSSASISMDMLMIQIK